MSSDFDLKTYLLSRFENQKYKNISLVELYVSDIQFFKTLERECKIEVAAMTFFRHKGKELLNAEKIPMEAFRKLKYEWIINDYLSTRQEKGKTPANETAKTENKGTSAQTPKEIREKIRKKPELERLTIKSQGRN